MQTAITIESLAKSYAGKPALKAIGFEVREGSCFGLLGPNGAGKSTTMKILCGLLDPDHGRVAVFGKDASSSGEEIRRQVGYVPQSITLYEKLSAADNLKFFGEMYGVRGPVLKERIADVLEQVGLADRAKDAVDSFSGGMKRRVNIAAALLHKPRLLIMDEPTVGIDPQSRNHIFEMIRSLQHEGVTVLYSTHYMEEVEALCDSLAIIDHGEVMAQGELSEVLDRFGTQAVYLELDGQQEPPEIAGFGKPVSKDRGWILETSSPLEAIASWAATCQAQALRVKQLEIVRPSLETVFLSLTGTTLRDV
ncbi:ABC transporter ATP-binding protein [Cohnella lubricantis]|uniref:ABC transporter ATP-binding protein n=1 Tax=Cohnella lubricantis TaxID=2163172 RepID=A0A841T608_9BACL|nr:ABC transporter ATP-binding protein [Cohnella lubricantis]MBB6676973.1 ABC transporter ATP-binding protein [Cohnella lubricantis]MBP2118378.1 ABC-2 type transport system ATP-binding protein [Cohnella lubricantis]